MSSRAEAPTDLAQGALEEIGHTQVRRVYTLDRETGEILWEINLGSPVTDYPISFAVDGSGRRC